MSDFRVSVEQISNIEPIPGKDRIILATINGWKCIVKKDEFNVGDFGLFFPPDSVLPSNDDRFDFMISKSFRVKTMKLGAAYSQGLLLPLKLFPEVVEPYQDNYASTFNVIKYERPEESTLKLMGNQKGVFPSEFRKTDQERVQNLTDIFEKFDNVQFEVTEKLDGTSVSIILTPGEDIRVCSRNFELNEEENNIYWNVARKHFPKGYWFPGKSSICIQGEIIGPGVQANPYKLKEPGLFVFDIQMNGGYLNPYEVVDFCAAAGLNHVPIIGYWYVSSQLGIEVLLNDAQSVGKKSRIYEGTLGEGLVYKSIKPVVEPFGNKRIMWSKGDHCSFKVINNEWLLKNE